MAPSVTLHGSPDDAGRSAGQESLRLGDLATSVERQIAALQDVQREARHRERSFRIGSRGEHESAARLWPALARVVDGNVHLLVDRRWPGTRRANIDLLLVGRFGVVVIDVKNWADIRIEDGRLWRGQADAGDDLGRVRDSAHAVAAALSGTGLAPPAVHAVLMAVGRDLDQVTVGGVDVVGERQFLGTIVGLGGWLDDAQVAHLAAAVGEQCPPAGDAVDSTVLHPRGRHAPPREAVETADLPIDAIWSQVEEVAGREPIEAWMAWMHPAQSQLATRSWSGPARIRGAAGTGKTVVALQRASHLAGRPDAHILVTSFVKTLPPVQRSLFERFATADRRARVEFTGVHRWARRFLSSRGRPPILADGGGKHLFADAWREVGADGPLAALALPRSYWRDEILYIIKGRELGDIGAYLALDRVGRRTPLRDGQRRAVWALYESYQDRLTAAGLMDFADLLSGATRAVQELPLERPYTSVIVDEVQDLTAAGLTLLHALVGDRPDGLLLVGDGQQAVYPGGFRLSEVGVSIAGRAAVLERNYRNAAEILKVALDVLGTDEFDDLDAEPSAARRAVTTARTGGQVRWVTAENARSQRTALLTALRAAADSGVRPGDMAVLVRSNRSADEWVTALRQVGVAAEPLSTYDGRTSGAVKVGTYERSKGLEFAVVFLPDHDRAVEEQGAGEAADAFRERAGLQRRRLFVAMTRARDRLWLGRIQR